MILKPAKYFQKSYRCNVKGASTDVTGVVISAISVDEGETICKIQVDEATSRAISKLENQVLAFFADNQEALMVTTKKRYDVLASFQSCTHVDHILKLRVLGEVDMLSLVGTEVTFKLTLKTLVIYKNHSYVTFTIDDLATTAPPPPSAELIDAVKAKFQTRIDELMVKIQELEGVLAGVSDMDVAALNKHLEDE